MADQNKLKKRLDALLKLPENQICADCRKRGVHISFVRSVNLDSWTVKQVDFMEEWGNARANEYYEANIPPQISRPKDGDSVRSIEKFIRDKYEFKRYVGKTVPPKQTNAPASTENGRDHHIEKPTEHHHPKHTETHRPSPAPITAPAPVVPPAKSAPAASLIDFLDDPVQVPAPSPTGTDSFGTFTSATPQQPDLFNFNVAPASAPEAVHSPVSAVPFAATSSAANFYPTGAAPPPSHQQQQHPQRPQASADAILSLYNTGGSASRISGMGGPGLGGMGAVPQLHPSHPGFGHPQQQQGQGQFYPPQQQHMFPPQQFQHGFAPPQGYPHQPQQQQQQQQFGMVAPVNPFAPNNGSQMMMQPPPAIPSQYPPHLGHPQQQQQQQQQQSLYGGVPSYNPPPVPVQQPLNPFLVQQTNRQPAPQWQRNY